MRIQKDIYHHELVKRGSVHVTATSKAVAARGNVHPGAGETTIPAVDTTALRGHTDTASCTHQSPQLTTGLLTLLTS